MAIAYDNSFHNDQVPVSNVLTYAFTCGSGSNRILFVGANVAAAQTISTITYAGASLTKVNTQAYNVVGVTELWALVAPASGVNNVVVTYNLAAATADSVVISYSGALQSLPVDSQGVTSAAGNVTDTRTSVADNCWHVAFMANVSNNFSAGANLTIRSGASNVIMGDNNAAITPAGAQSITGNNSGTSTSNGVTFAPFVAAASTAHNLSLVGAGT